MQALTLPQSQVLPQIKLKPFQEDFILSDAKFPAFVCAWGTGKTMCAIVRGWLLSQNYSNNLGVIFRKEFSDLKDSTMRDFQDYTGIDMKLQQVVPRKDILLPNNSQILFRHADDLPSLQNVNLGWFFVEQMEEFETDEVWFTLLGRLRRQGVFRTGFLTANAHGHNWIWKIWKDNPGKDYVLFGDGITTFDNEENLPADFIQTCRDLEVKKPAFFRCFVKNDMDEEDVSNFIMNRQVVEKAKEIKIYEKNKRLVSIDPSILRDEFVIYIFEGAKIIDHLFLNPTDYPQRLTIIGAGEAVKLANQYNVGLITVDSIGLGGPIVETIGELIKPLQNKILKINSALPCENEEDREHYLNLRAKMWFYAWEQIEQGKVCVPDDSELINQLCSVKFKYIKGKYRVEEKEEIKKRLQRSPDRADAFVQGIWAMQFCPITGEREDYQTFQFNFKGRKTGY